MPADLDDNLYRLRTSQPSPSAAAAASGGGDGGTPPLLLAAALCTLCTAHAAVEDHAAHAGAGASYADSLQRSVVRGYALTAVAELAARLAAACASSSSSSKGDGNSIGPASTHTNAAAGAELLPALWALLRWMGTPLATAALVPPLRDSGAGGAGAAGGAPEQAAALQSALRRLWGALAQLVAALHPAVALAAAKDPLQGPPAGAAASLPTSGNLSSGSGSAGSMHASGVQLPEDWHLQCFAPLPEAAGGAGGDDAAADAAQAAPAPTSEPARWLLRARRVLGAARALAAALQPADGSREAPPKGDPLALFLTAVRISMGGAARERPQQAQQGAAQQAPAVPAAQQPPAAPAGQQQQHQQAPRGGLPGLLPAAGAAGGAVVAGDGVAGMEIDVNNIEEEVRLG